MPIKTAKKNEVIQEEPTKPKKSVGRPRKNPPSPPKPKVEKLLFKMYIDAKTGKTWSNYYAMRSGKTNALCFIGTKRIFSKVSDEINNINAAIAKGVLGIQRLCQ